MMEEGVARDTGKVTITGWDRGIGFAKTLSIWQGGL